MTSSRFHLPGPGRTQDAYLELLLAGWETGWWDEHGKPAPWPEDFLDVHSGWHPAGGDDTNPDNVPF